MVKSLSIFLHVQLVVLCMLSVPLSELNDKMLCYYQVFHLLRILT